MFSFNLRTTFTFPGTIFFFILTRLFVRCLWKLMGKWFAENIDQKKIHSTNSFCKSLFQGEHIERLSLLINFSAANSEMMSHGTWMPYYCVFGIRFLSSRQVLHKMLCGIKKNQVISLSSFRLSSYSFGFSRSLDLLWMLCSGFVSSFRFPIGLDVFAIVGERFREYSFSLKNI